MQTFNIYKENFNWLQDKISKLNKKAKKLNCEPIQLKIENEYLEEVGPASFIPMYEVSIFGEAPSYSGWKFLGSLEHSDTVNVFHTVPGEEIPEKYRQASIRWCDHCKTRRLRKNTYIVKNEEGITKQVGKSCLKDFLGHISPQKLANFVDELTDLISFEGSIKINNISPEQVYKVSEILSLTACFIIEYGWMSKKKSIELLNKYNEGESNNPVPFSTAQYVTDYFIIINPKSKEEEKYIKEIRDVVKRNYHSEDVKNLLNGTYNWMEENKNSSFTNEYLNNIIALIENEYTTLRNFGLAASVVGSYYNKKKKEEENNISKTESNYIGEIKQRLTFNFLTVKFSREFESAFGIKILYKFQDENDNIITWWCSNNSRFDVGETIKAKATIKDHNEYNNKKETIITRLSEIK